eukprot:SAG31_NODE_772_length_12197_cov_7.075963_9_plen_90_part_00
MQFRASEPASAVSYSYRRSASRTATIIWYHKYLKTPPSVVTSAVATGVTDRHHELTPCRCTCGGHGMQFRASEPASAVTYSSSRHVGGR